MAGDFWFFDALNEQKYDKWKSCFDFLDLVKSIFESLSHFSYVLLYIFLRQENSISGVTFNQNLFTI